MHRSVKSIPQRDYSTSPYPLFNPIPRNFMRPCPEKPVLSGKKVFSAIFRCEHILSGPDLRKASVSGDSAFDCLTAGRAFTPAPDHRIRKRTPASFPGNPAPYRMPRARTRHTGTGQPLSGRSGFPRSGRTQRFRAPGRPATRSQEPGI